MNGSQVSALIAMRALFDSIVNAAHPRPDDAPTRVILRGEFDEYAARLLTTTPEDK